MAPNSPVSRRRTAATRRPVRRPLAVPAALALLIASLALPLRAAAATLLITHQLNERKEVNRLVSLYEICGLAPELVAQPVIAREPYDVAIDPNGRWALCTCRIENAVSVLSLQGSQPQNVAEVARVRVGEVPQGIAISPDGRWAVVALRDHDVPAMGFDAIAVLDLTGALPVYWKYIRVGDGPGADPIDCGFAADGRVLVTFGRSGLVLVVEVETGQIVQRIDVGGNARCIALNPQGTLAAVTSIQDQGGPDENKVTLIDTTHWPFRRGASRRVGLNPEEAAISSQGIVVVANSGDNTVSLLRVVGLDLLPVYRQEGSRLIPVEPIRTNENPTGVTIHDAENVAYVACFRGQAVDKVALGPSYGVVGQIYPVPYPVRCAVWHNLCPATDVSVTLLAEPVRLLTGERCVYKAVVTNRGPRTADQVRVEVRGPAELIFEKGDASHGGHCPPPSPRLAVATWPSLLPGVSVMLTVTSAPIDCALADGTSLTTEAEASSRTPDDRPENNKDSVTRPVTNACAADLTLSGTGSPDPVVAGRGEIRYTFTLTNKGPAPAKDVKVTGTLPFGLEQPSCIPPSGCQSAPIPASGDWSVTCAELPAHQSLKISLTGKVSCHALLPCLTIQQSCRLLHTARAFSSAPDPNPADNETIVVTEVENGCVGQQ